VQVQFKNSTQRRFDLVIGADGLHSNVRRLVFGPQDAFERQLGYTVAAFEIGGYEPRTEDIYVIYSKPGRMLGRATLRGDRTLFLFVFAGNTAGAAVDLSAQKKILHETYGADDWECPRILEQLEGTQELYFDRVSQIRCRAGRAAGLRWWAMPPSAYPW
jgi:2-polyprenyl-6-methoxyphenol hydroxylase-like FAD-dependent oxidoreductase